MKIEEAIKTLTKAVLQLQKDVKASNKIISDNLDFVSGLGDVSQQMADVLTTMMEERDATLKNTLEQFTTSHAFFKETISNKYADQNIMQEWFSDMVVEIISQNSPDDYDVEYITEWLDLKFRSFKIKKRTLPATLRYHDRVEFGESIFKEAMAELGMTEFGLFVLRSMYIPYSSLYYLQPLFKYPYIDEYMDQIEKFKDRIDEIEVPHDE